jgi:hypothetical protein
VIADCVRTEPSARDQAEPQSETVINDLGVDQVKKEEEEEPALPSTPRRSGASLYAESPTSEKRKRMESLALSRSNLGACM